MATKAAQSVSRMSRRAATSTLAGPAQPSARVATKTDPDELRILVTSHSHPKLTKGGAEISAYALYRGLQEQRKVKAWFLGCSGKKIESRLGSCITQPFGPSEYVYDPMAEFDYFKFANRDPEFPKAFEGLITELAPDIVHAHHYAIFGVESFWLIKRIRPQAKIFVTLHEYLAICHNHGQMVKAQTNRLCRSESPIDCHTCFPYISRQDFFLRKSYFTKFFGTVDRFIAPSKFLAERYAAWGLPEEKISVQENVMPRMEQAAAPHQVLRNKSDDKDSKQLRVGFFGQMSTLKGIKVLIEASKMLYEREVLNVLFDIYGDYTNQPADFQDELIKALEDEDLRSNFRVHGSYENENVDALMQSVDVVVIPSIWWENSPVVIREALRNRRPLICSNIGGMAEKVRPDLDGLHFAVGDASSLVETLEYLLAHPDVIGRLKQTLQEPAPPEETLRQHLQLYAGILPSRVAV
jgi:glycosyltransferase involved in cell wall biosynthesis